jgi:hypothetical protein
MLRRHTKFDMIIGPLPIRMCKDKVNEIRADKTTKVYDVKYHIVSANFVHPDQSYIMAVITYRQRGFI